MPDTPTPELEREIAIARAEIHAVNTHAQLEDELEDRMRLAFALGEARTRERDARIAESPYSDQVAAFGFDQPLAVGEKIAAAIRAADTEEK